MVETPAPPPDPWLLGAAAAFGSELPGPVLDVACGGGRNALWLAGRGVEVVGVDVSDERITYARRLALATNARAHFFLRDLEREGLPEGPWGTLLVFHYLQRDLFAGLESCLLPGGLLAYKTHLTHRLRGPGARPRREAFLLRPGELLGAFPALRTLEYREWAAAGGAYAALLARKPAG
ncbi:MAG: class I SAM-dependent methyltransferase [Deltaproteobacteria bacterium]|nr:class I SAM-dependent methyltransferase [Deltaproteobacteria bacterium]